MLPPVFTKECVAAVILPIAIRFPAVPFTVKVVNVVVVPAVNFRVCGGVSTFKSLKVLDPTILNSQVPDHVNQILLKVFHHPENVFVCDVASVILTVEVFALKVRPVIVAVFQTVPVPERVQVPDPIVIVRVLEFVEAKLVKVRFLLFASIVPVVCVRVLFDVILSCKVIVSFTMSNVIPQRRVFPALVRVLLEPFVLNVAAPVDNSAIPEMRVMFP